MGISSLLRRTCEFLGGDRRGCGCSSKPSPQSHLLPFKLAPSAAQSRCGSSHRHFLIVLAVVLVAALTAPTACLVSQRASQTVAHSAPTTPNGANATGEAWWAAAADPNGRQPPVPSGDVGRSDSATLVQHAAEESQPATAAVHHIQPRSGRNLFQAVNAPGPLRPVAQPTALQPPPSVQAMAGTTPKLPVRASPTPSLPPAPKAAPFTSPSIVDDLYNRLIGGTAALGDCTSSAAPLSCRPGGGFGRRRLAAAPPQDGLDVGIGRVIFARNSTAGSVRPRLVRSLASRRRLTQQPPDPNAPASGSSGSSSPAPMATSTNASACAVLLRYGASVGDPTTDNDVPIFVGSWAMALVTPALPTITSWALGWTFNAGERLTSARDVFSEGGDAAEADGGQDGSDVRQPAQIGTVILQENQSPSGGTRPMQSVLVFGNGSLAANGPALSFSMLGRKGPVGTSNPALNRTGSPSLGGPPSAPLRVAPVGNVFLNNMRCVPLLDLLRRSQEATQNSAGPGPPPTAPESGGSAANGSVTPPSPPSDYDYTAAGSDAASDSMQRAAPLLENPPHVLEVSYMPITYVTIPDDTTASNTSSRGLVVGNAATVLPRGQGGEATSTSGGPSPSITANSFTQMYLCIMNKGSRRNIPLYTVQVQYWFEGVAQSLDPWVDGSIDPTAPPPYQVFCSDTTTELRGGCNSVVWNVSPGLSGVRGARYLLSLSFAADAGQLAPAGAANSTASNATDGGDTSGPVLASVEMIISIEPLRVEPIDARQDYSYMETPVIARPPPAPPQQQGPAANTTTTPANAAQRVVLRQRQPNPRIPAFYNGFIAWGSPPAPAPQPPSSPPPSPDSPLGRLPAGSSCSTSATDGTLNCRVSTVYCCGTEGIIVTAFPANWSQILANGSFGGTASKGVVPGIPILAGGSNPGSGTSSNPQSGTQTSKNVSGNGVTQNSPSMNDAMPAGGDGGGSGGSRRTAAIAAGSAVGGAVLLTAAGATLFCCFRRPPGPGTPDQLAAGRRRRRRKGIRVHRRLSRYVGQLLHGVKRSDAAYNSSTSNSTSRSASLLPTLQAGDDGGYGGDMCWTDVVNQLEQIRQQQPLVFPTAIHVTASEAFELQVLNADWWQDNFTAKVGALGLGLMPRYRTLPATALMRAVHKLSPPSTQELEQALRRGPTGVAGPGEAGRLGEGGEDWMEDNEGADGVEGGGAGRSGREASRATLAAVPGLDDDDVRLRILVRKFKTWTGRVAETWELMHDYSPYPLLPPLQPESPMLQPPDQQHDPNQQPYPQQLPPQLVKGESQSRAFLAPPLLPAAAILSRLLPRRRTFASPITITPADAGASAAAGAPSQAPSAPSHREHHGERKVGGSADAGPAGFEGASQRPSPPLPFHHAQALPSRKISGLGPLGSFLRGGATGQLPGSGSGGGAIGSGLPMSLSLAPIELNVDYENEVEPCLGRLIGVGGFGRVYEGTFRGRRVAVKTVTIDSEVQRQALVKEAQMCARFRNCDRIVQLLAASLGVGTAGAWISPSQSAGGAGPGAAAGTRTSDRGSGGGAAAPPSPAGSQPHATPGFSSPPSGIGAGAARGATSRLSGGGGGGSETYAVSYGEVLPGQPAHQQTTAAAATPLKQNIGRRLSPAGTAPQHAALIMELCEGGNLGDRIRNSHMRRLDYLEVLQLSRDVAQGLAVIHRYGVLHRDLKPGNVLLDSKGRAKIADFGISRLRDPYRSCINVTQQGGTPNYMAPELFNGTRVDERADLYSLGCIMYEALTRRAPFDDLVRGGPAEGGGGLPMGGLFAIILAVAIQRRRPPVPKWVPQELADLIRDCWAEEPRARPTAEEVYARLDALIVDEIARRQVRATARAGPRVRMNHGSLATGGADVSSLAMQRMTSASASSTGGPPPSPPASPCVKPDGTPPPQPPLPPDVTALSFERLVNTLPVARNFAAPGTSAAAAPMAATARQPDSRPSSGQPMSPSPAAETPALHIAPGIGTGDDLGSPLSQITSEAFSTPSSIPNEAGAATMEAAAEGVQRNATAASEAIEAQHPQRPFPMAAPARASLNQSAPSSGSEDVDIIQSGPDIVNVDLQHEFNGPDLNGLGAIPSLAARKASRTEPTEGTELVEHGSWRNRRKPIVMSERFYSARSRHTAATDEASSSEERGEGEGRRSELPGRGRHLGDVDRGASVLSGNSMPGGTAAQAELYNGDVSRVRAGHIHDSSSERELTPGRGGGGEAVRAFGVSQPHARPAPKAAPKAAAVGDVVAQPTSHVSRADGVGRGGGSQGWLWWFWRRLHSEEQQQQTPPQPSKPGHRRLAAGTDADPEQALPPPPQAQHDRRPAENNESANPQLQPPYHRFNAAWQDAHTPVSPYQNPFFQEQQYPHQQQLLDLTQAPASALPTFDAGRLASLQPPLSSTPERTRPHPYPHPYAYHSRPQEVPPYPPPQSSGGLVTVSGSGAPPSPVDSSHCSPWPSPGPSRTTTAGTHISSRTFSTGAFAQSSYGASPHMSSPPYHRPSPYHSHYPYQASPSRCPPAQPFWGSPSGIGGLPASAAGTLPPLPLLGIPMYPPGTAVHRSGGVQGARRGGSLQAPASAGGGVEGSGGERKGAGRRTTAGPT